MAKDIGIDLGTANVLVHLKGRGVILNEPAVVAFDKDTREVVAYGKDAYDMIGRTGESIDVVRPLKSGVIADFELTEAMLTLFFDKVNPRQFFSSSNILICTPSEISEVEQQSLIEAIERVGGGKVFVEQEVMVAAVGAGVDVLSPKGSMIIDIGGGTTDIAAITAGEIIESQTLTVAGDEFDQAIIQYFKREKNILIGQRTAEEMKMQISAGTLLSQNLLKNFDLKGRDLLTGLPKSITVNSNDIYFAIKDLLIEISRAAKTILEDVSPEIAGDIIENGIVLTGGGALIYNIDNFLSEQLGVSVIRADQPMTCVAIGSGLMLEMIQAGTYKKDQPSKKQKLLTWIYRIKRRIFG